MVTIICPLDCVSDRKYELERKCNDADAKETNMSAS